MSLDVEIAAKKLAALDKDSDRVLLGKLRRFSNVLCNNYLSNLSSIEIGNLCEVIVRFKQQAVALMETELSVSLCSHFSIVDCLYVCVGIGID